MSQSISFRQATFIVVTFAVSQFIIQTSLILRGVEYLAASLVIDDTYYYLQTAWNAKVLGFVTFDGLHPTNGVQLLWFGVIFLLALLAKSKIVLLIATLIVSFLFNGLCYLIILKLGVVLKQPILALLMASLWALQSLPFRIYSIGMENSLHALVFWCVVWQSVEFLIRIRNKETPNFLGLTAVLILLVWTRLDSALISVVLFTFCIGTLAYTHRHNLGAVLQKHGRSITGSITLAVFGLLVQLTAFWIMGNSFLPVSALVKTSITGRGSDVELMDKFVGVFTLGMPSILQGRFLPFVLVLFGIFGMLLVILARVIMREYPEGIQAFLNLWSCLLVGEVMYYAYVTLSGVEYAPYFIWYRSPSFIFWIITGSLIALFTCRLIRVKLVKHSSNILKLAPVGLGFAIFTVAIYMFARSINFTSNLYVARYAAALWMAENSPPDAVFASWNAGQLGFFSNHAVINLDGVINSVDYYERVLLGSMPLSDYLIENNVDFLVDYSTYDSVPDFPIVHTFPLNDESGRSIHIWQVPSQLSSNP